MMDSSLIWILSLGCLMVTLFSCLVVMNNWQKNSLKTLSDFQESQLKEQHELVTRLVTMLGTKDPLAYQAIIAADQSLGAFETVSASDEAEAARYNKMMAEGGYIGYPYNVLPE